jgi:hypothetical protein
MLLSFLKREGTMNVFHYSFQGVTAFRLERSKAFLTVQRYNRSALQPFTAPDRLHERFVNVCENLMSAFDRL